ncbi:MAG TPA: hypothetical protein VJM08_14205 [Anaerolineales bacterium]|nr:hypothetical protein [Anaerolineales bacterium]
MKWTLYWFNVFFLFLILFSACTSSSDQTDVPMTQLPIFFPQLLPANGERAYPEALLEGTLIIVNDCLRVQARAGDTSYLIIWPPHVVSSITNDMIQVTDQGNGAVAQVDETVQLGGGEISPEAPMVQELREPLPATCPGPYWIASGIVR